MRADRYCGTSESESRAILQVDQNVISLDAHRESPLHNHKIRIVLAGGQVELPTMPRAGDDVARQATFGQRPTLVRTDTVQRKVLTAQVKQGDDVPVGQALDAPAGGAVADSGNSGPFCHFIVKYRTMVKGGKTVLRAPAE
jgi:hypothetical protein